MIRLFASSLFIFYIQFIYAQPDTLIDPRDNQAYSIIDINGIKWFAQNLNFNTKKSECFEDSIIQCGDWGRLYNRKESHVACPTGWRLPTGEDWNSLDSINIFDLLDTSYWKKNFNHTNKTGLSLQPSGIKHRSEFWNQYLSNTIWFDDINDKKDNWHLHTHGNNGKDGRTHVFHNHKQLIRIRKFSVRCVQ